MLEPDDIAYFRLREEEERQLAALAPSATVAAAHVRLADHYAQQLSKHPDARLDTKEAVSEMRTG